MPHARLLDIVFAGEAEAIGHTALVAVLANIGYNEREELISSVHVERFAMAKVTFAQIRTKVQSGDYEISFHAFERMRQRGITIDDLENVIIHGKIIEADAEAKPFSKCVFWGFTVDKGESIHVVCSVTPRSKVVTVYFPDEDQWVRERIRRR